MSGSFVVHYSEIALKGKNRPEFVKMLRRNIGRALTGLEPEIHPLQGRFFLTVKGDKAEGERRLAKVFGVAWFAEAAVVDPEYGKIKDAVIESARSSSGKSFKINPRRADKSFPINSMELARTLGGEVAEATGKKVDLSNPDVQVHVDVLKDRALVYSRKVRGPGGLPVGTAGRVMHLFSGGIDSPPAAWLMMKRGCRPVYLHFYLAPTGEAPLKSKVMEEVKALSAWGGKSTLVLVPFAEYQLATAEAPNDLEPSLFRRFMRMTAEALAPLFGASGISTGDSLSQAASQTLWNLAAFDQGSTLPVLRPLLTYDKEEIITLAKQIGTYETSLEEYKDCCAIISRHPRTKAKGELISKFADELGFRVLLAKSLRWATLVSYNPATGETKVTPLDEAMRRPPAGQASGGSLKGAEAELSVPPRQNYKQATGNGFSGDTT
ncbi:MAG: tRNA 4-thiouridine(8) synthase ThiI [Thaumarchaeota archaeon]|nr:tRNA 4-thiouridine(8) synthase ThiI [Nitrososphaerota archaeon]